MLHMLRQLQKSYSSMLPIFKPGNREDRFYFRKGLHVLAPSAKRFSGIKGKPEELLSGKGENTGLNTPLVSLFVSL